MGRSSRKREKMLAGLPYQPSDPELDADRRNARRLTRLYNDTEETEFERRKDLILLLFGSAGSGFDIEPPFRCDYGYNIRVGDNFYAHFGCVILDQAPVLIGNNVSLSPGVHIYTAFRPLDLQSRGTALERGSRVSIGNNVWIGGSAVINPGVTIGDNTVIGSGSVVTKPVPANVVAAGNPCRIIRDLT